MKFLLLVALLTMFVQINAQRAHCAQGVGSLRLVNSLTGNEITMVLDHAY